MRYNQKLSQKILLTAVLILLIYTSAIYIISAKKNPCLNNSPDVLVAESGEYIYLTTEFQLFCSESDYHRFLFNAYYFGILNKVGYLLILLVFFGMIINHHKKGSDGYICKCLSEYEQGIKRIIDWFRKIKK